MTSLFDDIISRQIGIERTKSGESKKLIELISELDNQIDNTINNLPENYTRNELNIALDKINKKTSKFYNTQVISFLNEVATGMVNTEIDFSYNIIEKYLTNEKAKKPNKNDVLDSVILTPFQNKLLPTWASNLGTDKNNRINTSVNNAANEGKAPNQLSFIAKQQIKISNNNADMVTKAYISQSSNISRDATYNENPESVEIIVWSSILDSGTTTTCAVRSNKKYDAITKKPIGHDNEWQGGPGKIHWGCRSTGIPTNKSGVIVSGSGKGEKIDDGTKTAVGAEKGYDRGGNLNVDGKRSKIPSTKNQLEKQLIPANENYSTWLKRQPRPFVEDTLGVGKAKLFLDDDVPIKSFVLENGTELTLQQLQNMVI